MPAFPLLLSVLEAGDEEVPDELPARTRRCASAGVKIDFSQVSRKRASSSWNREAMVGVSMSVSAMSYPMADSIKDTIPNVLKTLWNLENELRKAAQNSVVLRQDEARKHLSEARRHLDELLRLARSSETTGPEGSRASTEAPPSKPSGKQL